MSREAAETAATRRAGCAGHAQAPGRATHANDVLWMAFRKRFRRHGVRDGARVLHLGSGGGSIDHHLKQNYRVTGVDIAPAMIAYAARLNPEGEYIQGDIRDVRLGQTTCDDDATDHRIETVFVTPAPSGRSSGRGGPAGSAGRSGPRPARCEGG